MTERFLSVSEATDWLAARGLVYSKHFLNWRRQRGDGPLFRLFGARPVYREEDLQDWLEVRLSEPMRKRNGKRKVRGSGATGAEPDQAA
jgi:hypothetical protein